MSSLWTPQALAAAITVLVAAVASSIVLMAKSINDVANIAHGLRRSGVPIRGTHTAGSHALTAPTLATALPTGAGAVLATPAWSQLTDVSISTRPAAASAVDCGPESAAIVVEATTGVPLPAEWLRYLWFGILDSRLVAADDIVGMLLLCRIHAHAVATTWPNIQGELARANAARELCVVLGNWLSPDLGHWLVVVGTGPQGPFVRDPWHGSQYLIDWGRFQALYRNSYVHVDRRDLPA